VVQVSDSSHKSLKGHEAPILSVTLDPDEEFLVTMLYITYWFLAQILPGILYSTSVHLSYQSIYEGTCVTVC
jgi:hypothetical protein